MADKWNFNDFSWVKTNFTDIENVIMKKILPDKSLDFAQTLGSNLEVGELYISGAQSDIYNSDNSVTAYRNLGTSYQQGIINKSKLTYIDPFFATIQLQDGKWNYSKFEWYESDNSNIRLYKILQSKALDSPSIAYSEMVDDELYIEDSLSEINKYNADEWAMAHVFLKGKKYYAYIKKSTIELNWLAPSPEQPQPPQPPISPEIPPTISGTTIKEQTEKAERLKNSLDDKVIAIADEIKKQDNIDITRLSEVPDAISQLKNSRKRWATGTDTVLESGRPGSYSCTLLTFPRLDFKPAFIWFFDYKGGYFSNRIVMASLREGNLYFYDVRDDSYQGHGVRYDRNVIKTDMVEVGTKIGYVVNYNSSSSSKYESQKSVSWIAFE